MIEEVSKTMSYKLVVFDWDGTLYDSADYIVRHAREAARVVQVPIPSDHAVRQVVGLSFDTAMHRLFGDLNRQQFGLVVAEYRRRVDAIDQQLPALFDGALAVLQALKQQGYQLAVATAKLRIPFDRDLVAFGLTRFFQITYCGEYNYQQESVVHQTTTLINTEK